MRLNRIEHDFLTRLSHEPWTSPPLFDHSLLERLVREKYVTSRATAHQAVYYEITDLGRGAIIGQQRRLAAVHAKTLSFFSPSHPCSIDFGRSAPMFRLNAARYRSAISRVSRLSAYP